MRRPLLVLAGAVIGVVAAAAPAAGVPAQTPKRGGTLVIRVLGPEPACLNVLPMSCNQGGQAYWSEKVLQTPFEVGPDFTYEESLVSRVDFTRQRPFTLTYHIRPEARWSDGVPVTAQDFIFTLRAIRRHGIPESVTSTPPSGARVPSIARPCEWFFGRGPRAGTTSSGTSFRRTRFAVRISTQVWSDRIDDPRTGRPIGSGPFLVERLERGRQLVLRRNPRYWGPHPAYVERLVIRFAEVATDPSEELRSGELDVATVGPPAFVPAVRRVPGVRLVTAAASDFEQLAVQLGPNAHPALRNKLVRRALAYGIDRTALVRQIWGEVDPSARALDSAVHLTQSRYYEPNWRAYRYRPAEARRLLEQAGCRRGADGIFSCGGQRLSLRFVTSAGFAIRAQALSPDPGAASGRRGRGRAGVRSPGGVLRPDPPAGDFDVALFSWLGSSCRIVGRLLRLRRAARTTLGTASGSSPPTSTRPTGCSTSRRTPVSSTEPTGGSRVTSRRSRSSSLSSTAAYDTSVRGFRFLPWNLLWNAENWWLDRSPRSGHRRRAPRRRGGRRHCGPAGAEARRDARHRGSELGTRVPQRSRRGLRQPGRREGPRVAVRHRPPLHIPAEARVGGHRTRRSALHADVPHSPRGALERWSAGHRSGLRLHAPCDPREWQRGRPEAPLRRPQHSRRRREDGSCRAASRSSRAGTACSRSSFLRMHSVARTSRRSGSTGWTTRRPVGRSGAVPSSSTTGSAGRSSFSGEIPTTGGRIPPIWIGS